MTGAALWAFGTIWLGAGFIVGAWLAGRAHLEEAAKWRSMAILYRRQWLEAREQLEPKRPHTFPELLEVHEARMPDPLRSTRR